MCDPSFKFLNAIRSEIKKINSSIPVYCYPSFETLLKELKSNFDAIMINTEIKNESGIEVALEIKKKYKDIEIIFVTQYGEKYAQMIYYNLDVLRPYAYFVKPVSRIYLQRVIAFLEQDFFKRSMGSLIIRDSFGDSIAIAMSDITYIEYGNRITNIFVKNGSCHSCRKAISCFESELSDKMFCHCSKSCIINLAEVSSMSGHEVILKSGKSVFASRNYKASFKTSFERYSLKTREALLDNDLLPV